MGQYCAKLPWMSRWYPRHGAGHQLGDDLLLSISIRGALRKSDIFWLFLNQIKYLATPTSKRQTFNTIGFERLNNPRIRVAPVRKLDLAEFVIRLVIEKGFPKRFYFISQTQYINM